MAQPSLELTRYGDFLHHSRAALTTRPRRLSVCVASYKTTALVLLIQLQILNCISYSLEWIYIIYFSLISNEAGRPNDRRPTNGIRIGRFRRAHYILNPLGRVGFHPPLVARSTSGKVLNRTGAEYMFKGFVDLLFYVHGKHLRSCRDGQLT